MVIEMLLKTNQDAECKMRDVYDEGDAPVTGVIYDQSEVILTSEDIG